MQEYALLAEIMWNISVGVLIAGLFYTFGMFTLGKLFAVISDHGGDHDYESDVEHDIDHDMEHDIDHDMEHDISHDIDHDIDHEKDYDHSFDTSVGIDVDSHSGFFEFSRDAPLGVTIGTSLVSFGFIGTMMYYDGIAIPVLAKMGFHFLSVFVIVYSMRWALGRIFIESGFHMTPKHLVGKEVEAVSTIDDRFGEIRTETEMGLRRFNAKPFEKGNTYKKGTVVWVISADDRFAYVDHRKDVRTWTQEQSRAETD